MLQLNTKLFKSIEFEIDGVRYATKKITNRIMMEGLRISQQLQDKDVQPLQSYELMVELLSLYAPLERDFILDKLDVEDVSKITTYITGEINKAVGVAEEPPLAGGVIGDKSPK